MANRESSANGVSVAGAIERAVERVPKLGRAGSIVAGGMHRVIRRGGKLTRKLADVLHGKWLGHPLHPMLTDFTIGAWFLGGLFDAVACITGSRKARWTGNRLAEIGTASAVPTALTGMTEYASAPKPAIKTATLHGLLNGASFGLYLASIWQRRRGRHARGAALSWTAQGIMLGSAWLGGVLVYKHRVGVDHSEHFTGPQEWTYVLDLYELAEHTPRRVEVEGQGVLLYRDNGHVHAIGAVCAHAGGPLEEGTFENGCVRCPWHDSVYDLRDGSVVHAPSTRPQPSFETRVRNGGIELRLAPEGAKGRHAAAGRAPARAMG